MIETPAEPRSSCNCRGVAVAVVILAFALPAAALIAAGINRGPRYDDQVEYHVPTIWQIAQSWPAVDVNAYAAAMTPGYHLVMVAVAKAGGGIAAMQAITALLTCGLFATLAWVTARSASTLDAVLLCLPAVFSPYVFTSGIYVVPHNLAWWGVLAVMLLSLRERRCIGTLAAFSIVFTALVMVMQIQAWALAPMLVGSFLPAGNRSNEISDRPSRWNVRHAIGVLLASLPAVLLLWWFAKQWGGLAPQKQEWVREVRRVNFAALAMMLATCGALGLFFLGWFWRKGVLRWAAIGAAIAMVIALIPESTYDKPAGRWGGLWNLAGVIPPIAGRSLVIIGLAAVGGFVLGAILGGLPNRDRWIFAAAIAGFAAAHATINQAWQRYYEPMILLTFILAATRVPQESPRIAIRRAALIALAAIQIGLTAMSLSK